MLPSRLLALAATAAALSPAAASAEQRRTLSVTAEVVASCTVTTTAQGTARASCDGGETVSISRRQRPRSGTSARRPRETTSEAETGGVEVVTLTF